MSELTSIAQQKRNLEAFEELVRNVDGTSAINEVGSANDAPTSKRRKTTEPASRRGARTSKSPQPARKSGRVRPLTIPFDERHTAMPSSRLVGNTTSTDAADSTPQGQVHARVHARHEQRRQQMQPDMLATHCGPSAQPRGVAAPAEPKTFIRVPAGPWNAYQAPPEPSEQQQMIGNATRPLTDAMQRTGSMLEEPQPAAIEQTMEDIQRLQQNIEATSESINLSARLDAHRNAARTSGQTLQDADEDDPADASSSARSISSAADARVTAHTPDAEHRPEQLRESSSAADPPIEQGQQDGDEGQQQEDAKGPQQDDVEEPPQDDIEEPQQDDVEQPPQNDTDHPDQDHGQESEQEDVKEAQFDPLNPRTWAVNAPDAPDNLLKLPKGRRISWTSPGQSQRRPARGRFERPNPPTDIPSTRVTRESRLREEETANAPDSTQPVQPTATQVQGAAANAQSGLSSSRARKSRVSIARPSQSQGASAAASSSQQQAQRNTRGVTQVDTDAAATPAPNDAEASEISSRPHRTIQQAQRAHRGGSPPASSSRQQGRRSNVDSTHVDVEAPSSPGTTISDAHISSPHSRRSSSQRDRRDAKVATRKTLMVKFNIAGGRLSRFQPGENQKQTVPIPPEVAINARVDGYMSHILSVKVSPAFLAVLERNKPEDGDEDMDEGDAEDEEL